jgi:hypothetical protein
MCLAEDMVAEAMIVMKAMMTMTSLILGIAIVEIKTESESAPVIEIEIGEVDEAVNETTMTIVSISRGRHRSLQAAITTTTLRTKAVVATITKKMNRMSLTSLRLIIRRTMLESNTPMQRPTKLI